MEKETVKKFDLESAFKALDELDIPTVARGSKMLANRVNLKERLAAKPAHEVLVEDYFDVNNMDDLEAAKEEREAQVAKAKLNRIEKIIDLDAETEDDILPSYVGKVIMQCPQCMTLFYKNEEDIETSEENPEVVNINEVCQHCGNASGYTLVGKVGNISEDEADNFDTDDIEVDENELNLDFSEEGEETAKESATEEEEFDLEELDLDLPEESEESEDELEDLEEEEPVEESLHNSELLKDIEADNVLKTEDESEQLTLNEAVEDIADNEAAIEAEAEEEVIAAESTEDTVIESANNSEVLKDAEADSELKTEFESKNLTLNEDAEDTFIDSLGWGEKAQPTEEEAREILAKLPAAEETEETEETDESFDNIEDFDEESFNEHLSKYMTEVYSNVASFAATSCSLADKQLIVEGIIKFNSGKEKTTKFVFEGTTAKLTGLNEDFSTEKAFILDTKVSSNKLITENLNYSYKIGEAAVAGTTKSN